MTVVGLRHDCLTNPNAYDVAILGAMMLYPRDAAARNRALSTTTITMMLENGHYPQPSSVDERREFHEIIRTVPRTTEFEDEVKDGFKRGMIAGSMVCDVLFRGSSLTATKKKLANTFKISVSLIDGQIWPDFKPVAAYWAVFLRIGQTAFDVPIPCRPEDLGKFLRMADDVRSTAERFKRPHSQSLLKPGETVAIPEEIALPVWPETGRTKFYKN